ncbi:MAG: CsgG/HfaB family protein [Proteobacteria bacterium]|jgi:TolB-like protein|nr:CsgG/HfaB family protein [Pseudomonadota bacterium]
MKYILMLLVFGLASCQLVDRREGSGPQKSITTRNELKEAEDSQPRKRLMILPFLDSNSERVANWREDARAEFISELNKSGSLIVIDSQDLKLDVSKYVVSNQYNFSDLAKAAQPLGVAALLEGQLLDLKVKRQADPVGVFRQLKTTFEAKVRLRIANVRSGKELFNTVKTVTVEEANMRVAENVNTDRFFAANPDVMENLVKEAFLDFTPQITSTMDKLSWEGRIAMIQGERIFLNVGKVSGLQVGDILKVSEDGEDIYDPQTGNYIGRVPGRLKGTLEVISYFGQDGSIAVIHSGSGFKENDKIELY